MFYNLLIAGLGGFVGTCLRYLTQRWTAGLCHGSFPTGTFLANIAGCLLIGIFLGLMQRHAALSPRFNAFFVTGLCGGLTTFSTFANDIYTLTLSRQMLTSSLYLVLTLLCGLVAVGIGRWLTRF